MSSTTEKMEWRIYIRACIGFIIVVVVGIITRGIIFFFVFFFKQHAANNLSGGRNYRIAIHAKRDARGGIER